MADHITEEEQIEALKRWWDENGKQVVLAIVLTVGGYFGWQAWTDHLEDQTAAASLVYQEMLDNMDDAVAGDTLAADKQAEISQLADILKQDYSNTQYAFYAALIKAKLAVESTDLSAASVELQWAMDNADETVSENIARLRLARVEAAAGNLDTALQLVQGVDAGELKSAFDEAKGDFYQQQGNAGAAYTAYEAAMTGIDAGNSSASQLLQLKISQVKPVISKAVEAEESVEQDDAL
ncbi:tetratricopeptide repeat protein [SAR92 clade bacterium H455]|uniref:Tetratricopeptide repeat protein n=1 Tax=SAR92 clade bacterium H455 TaxID=2974818 RepID=A0ABY5TLI3_9GAMM|nr:tetratricopeptide repeat protein [SAR92 clade bacterium H455]